MLAECVSESLFGHSAMLQTAECVQGHFLLHWMLRRAKPSPRGTSESLPDPYYYYCNYYYCCKYYSVTLLLLLVVVVLLLLIFVQLLSLLSLLSLLLLRLRL